MKNRPARCAFTIVLALALCAGRAAARQPMADAVDIHDDDPPLASPVWVRAPVPAPVPVPSPAPPRDPARTRLSLFPTAETLGRGEAGFVSRGMLTTEVAFGATDWLELGAKMSPILAFIPPIGFSGSYWAGGIRLRIVKSSVFNLTVDSDGMSILGYAGVRAGLTLKLGSDRFALHGGGSAFRLWQVAELGQDAVAAACVSGCSTERERRSMTAIFAHGGLEVRLHRKVKLMTEVSYYRDAGMDALFVAPAVRLHGRHFAIDLGLLGVKTKRETLPIPLVNLSVTY